jgi:hypothetical protein
VFDDDDKKLSEGMLMMNVTTRNQWMIILDKSSEFSWLNIILIGRTDFIYFVHMFLGILPSSATRKPRLLVGFVLLDP